LFLSKGFLNRRTGNWR